MKMLKIVLSVVLVFVVSFAYSQNSSPWPTNGNVGIGTSDPQSLLDVNYSSGFGVKFGKNLFNTSNRSFNFGVGSNWEDFSIYDSNKKYRLQFYSDSNNHNAPIPIMDK